MESTNQMFEAGARAYPSDTTFAQIVQVPRFATRLPLHATTDTYREASFTNGSCPSRPAQTSRHLA